MSPICARNRTLSNPLKYPIITAMKNMFLLASVFHSDGEFCSVIFVRTVFKKLFQDWRLQRLKKITQNSLLKFQKAPLLLAEKKLHREKLFVVAFLTLYFRSYQILNYFTILSHFLFDCTLPFLSFIPPFNCPSNSIRWLKSVLFVCWKIYRLHSFYYLPTCL